MTDVEAKRAAWAACDEEERKFWRDLYAVFGQPKAGRWPGGIEWGEQWPGEPYPIVLEQKKRG